MRVLDRRDFLKLAGAGALGSAVLPAGCAESPSPRARGGAQPNLVLIMADDMGSECVGAYGGLSYRTPHLDRLAGEGMRFEHCYSLPMCVPSRVQIMTGRYNVRNYGWEGLDENAHTFATALRAAGYATCVAGKWQLNRGFDQPDRFGFDDYCLWQLTRDREDARRYGQPQLEIAGRERDFSGGQYGPDVVTDHLCAFMRRERDRPFFAYYPMLLPHWPFGPTPDSPDWDPHREPGGDRGRGDPRYFADMVAYMDRMVGKLVAQLDALGLRERTLVLFTSDNGTYHEIRTETTRGTVQGGKRSLTDAGTRVPLVASWPGVVPAGRVSQDLVDFTDFLPTLCESGGAPLPEQPAVDGRSFLSQLRGERGEPREWVYCWFSAAPTREPREFARTQRYKRYRSGGFFDLARDRLESRPLDLGRLDPEARAAYEMLGSVLERFRHARPAELARTG